MTTSDMDLAARLQLASEAQLGRQYDAAYLHGDVRLLRLIECEWKRRYATASESA